MAHGDFVWCDLSTFHVDSTKDFYAGLFGWQFDTIAQPDGAPYHIASAGRRESAAVFEMPKRFQKIGLPSFWMSYISVDDIEAAVAGAGAMGGKVEVGPLPFGDGASIALVRDPLGAGFTLYQGDDLKPRPGGVAPGNMAWNALYVSNMTAVKPFYEALFGWQIADDPAQPDAMTVRNGAGKHVSDIHQLTDAVRGKHQFWGVHFAVADPAATKAKIKQSGGAILYEESGHGGPLVLAQDRDGAAFFVTPATRKTTTDGTGSSSVATAFRWRTVLALAILWTAVMFEWNWVWGVLFLMWTVHALRRGQTFLVEPIGRAANPVLFWAIVASWIVLSLFLIIYDLVSAFT